jgi:hypothetical protein
MVDAERVAAAVEAARRMADDATLEIIVLCLFYKYIFLFICPIRLFVLTIFLLFLLCQERLAVFLKGSEED